MVQPADIKNKTCEENGAAFMSSNHRCGIRLFFVECISIHICNMKKKIYIVRNFAIKINRKIVILININGEYYKCIDKICEI